MNPKEIQKAFDSFNQLNVLIIGDIMVDAYLFGEVDRISPEAPVPIISIQTKENRLGGAANVALNVKELGANPLLFTVIGEDEKGKTIVDLLKDNEISSAGIIQSKNRRTTSKTRVIGSNQQMLRVDEEIKDPIDEAEKQQLLKAIEVAVSNKGIDVIVFEDYDKGIISPTLIEKVVELAKENNIPVAVDPKKNNFSAYIGVTLFKPNLSELKDGLAIANDLTDVLELSRAIDTLKKKQAISIALVTLSEKGVFISDDNHQELIPACIRNIADVSGAGDTVISVAALCLALRLPAPLIALIANVAGGIVCEKVGVVPINKEQLKEEVFTSIQQ